MPDDLAKKVNDTLNRKSLIPEDELADALEEMARDIALIEPDPQDWGGWVSLFLEHMEFQAKKRRLINNYEQALEILAIKIQNRIQGGKWPT